MPVRYPYSDSWVQHAKRFVDDAAERLGLSSDSFVVEVASDDGYLLQHVVAAGIPDPGIEASVEVGAAARKLRVRLQPLDRRQSAMENVGRLAGAEDSVDTINASRSCRGELKQRQRSNPRGK
jgi:hypothetical protein